ncbi:hypothetical protein [Xanthocytophaga agilis]|uniref:Uncharacterized protein n=1 Tax=Xanthocytophaga agilis TaxID=3048010 RepID=A0AAE3UC83_9BACT|nr:hypothetical protein [Xanthocytophaga agilis]MDJ1500668.1 hypothetical protein [Xanthocytophaga agilis]
MIQLYINGKLAQLSDTIDLAFDKIVSDYNDPTKKTGSYSYTFTLPYTKVNNLIFNRENDRQKIGKFKGVYEGTLLYADTIIFDGELVHKENNSNGYSCFLSGSKDLKIASIIGDGSIRDIQSFTPVPFSGDSTVHSYLGEDWYYVPSYLSDPHQSEIAFTLVPDGYAKLGSFKEYYQTFYELEGITYAAGYHDYGLSLFTGAIFENIFRDAGWTLKGDVLHSEDFRRLILLYSNQDDQNPYNYGTLNPLKSNTIKVSDTAKLVNSTTRPITLLKTRLETVTTLNYGKISCIVPYLNVIEGDFSFSLQTPESVHTNGGNPTYTCKYSGEYTFNLDLLFSTWDIYRYDELGLSTWSRTSDFISDTNGSELFFAFREVTESQFLDMDFERQYPTLRGLYKADANTLYSEYLRTADSNEIRHLNKTLKVQLEEGKQYQLQFYYWSLENTKPVFEFRGNSTSGSGDTIAIASCNGKTQINPADFLPNLKKIDFVNALFKLFNLFYQTDTETKTLTFYRRDEFFDLNKNNIIDLSKRLNLNDFKEEPFDEDTVLASQFLYANDSNDYVLKTVATGQTQTYYQLVNSAMNTEAKTIPFAPLYFFRRNWLSDSDYVFSATLPFVLTSDNYKMANLTSIAYSNGFNYTPRLALFYGGYYNEQYYLDQGSQAVLPMGKFVRSFFATGKSIPHLTFFALDQQPVYELDYYLQEDYKLLAVTGFSFTTDPNIIGNSGLTQTMQDYGLDLTTNSESITERLYKKTYRNLDQSFLTSGPIKMDALLFKNMSGRQLLKLNSDLYLLDRIEKFRPQTAEADITIFKLIV